MVIKLKTELKDLDGKTIMYLEAPMTLGRSLANILLAGQDPDKMKLYRLATKCHDQEELETDEKEMEFIMNAINQNATFAPLIVGQVLTLLEDEKVCVK
jgi:hypothetical protein